MESTGNDLTMGSLFRTMIGVGKKAASRLAIFAMIGILPGVALTNFAYIIGFEEIKSFVLDAEKIDWQIALLMLLILSIGIVLLVFLSTWSYLAALEVLHREMDGEYVSVRDAYRRTREFVSKGIWYFFLSAVRIILMSIVVLIPLTIIGIILYGEGMENMYWRIIFLFLGFIDVPFLAWWILGPNAIMFEGVGIRQAFKRSVSLVKGVWWKTAGFVFFCLFTSRIVLDGVFKAISLTGWYQWEGYFGDMVGDVPDSAIESASFGDGLVKTMLSPGLELIIDIMLLTVVSTVLYAAWKKRQIENATTEESDANNNPISNTVV